MYDRLLTPLLSNSFFLFGPRGTGKTTFLRNIFKNHKTLWFDLLDIELEDELIRNPNSLIQQIKAKENEIDWVVIDEIQKAPKLLNLIHQQIENSSVKFALTGSSARKLKKGSANLLAGRAFVYNLYPFTTIELGDDFELNHALNWGLLPKISHFNTDEEKVEYLKAYALTYLKEEVWSEHLIRNLDPFRRYLEIAAQTDSEIINYSNIAKDVGADIKTVQSYYEIMEDTMLGFFLDPYHSSIRKQQRQSPKFYFFDNGVKKALSRTLSVNIIPNTYAYGKAFEHFFIAEVFRLNNYFKKDFKLSYLLTKDNVEIDLIIERPGAKTLLIEIKSSINVDERDVKTLKRFTNDFKNSESLVVSNDPKEKIISGICALHWKRAIAKIFNQTDFNLVK